MTTQANGWRIIERNAAALRQDAAERHAAWVREREEHDRFAALIVFLLTTAYVALEVLR